MTGMRRHEVIFFSLITTFCACTEQIALSQTIPPPPVQPKVDANGIDVRTGNEMWSMKELAIGPDDTMGLQLVRAKSGGSLRDSFSSSYFSSENLSIPTAAAGFATFDKDGDSFGEYAPLGHGYPGNPYVPQDGSVITFNIKIFDQYDPTSGDASFLYYADSKTFPNGVKWTLHYKTITGTLRNYARIQSVTSNTGYQIKFTYQTNTMAADFSNSASWETRTAAYAINNAVEYCDPMADSCSFSNEWPSVSYGYSYNSSTGVNSVYVTDARGGTTQYYGAPASGGAPPYFAIKKPGSVSDDVRYTYILVYGPCYYGTQVCQTGSPFRVSSVATPAKTVAYSYSEVGDRWVITATEPDLTKNRYENTKVSSSLLKWTDRMGRSMTFENNNWNETTKSVWPQFNYSDTPRGSCGAIESESAFPKSGYFAAPITMHNVIIDHGSNMKLCGKISSTTDARGNTTDYTYDGNHGGVLTEVGPADVNGVRPAKKYIYGQRYAVTKAASGAFVQAATPVWVLAEVRSCKTSSLNLTSGECAGGTGDLVKVTFDYGPTSGVGNNILVREKVESSNGLILRTCYSYDRYGRKMSEIKPRANLGSCN